MKYLYIVLIISGFALSGCSVKKQLRGYDVESKHVQLEVADSTLIIDNSVIERLMSLMADDIEIIWRADSIVTMDKSIYGSEVSAHLSGVKQQNEEKTQVCISYSDESKENQTSDSRLASSVSEDKKGVAIAEPASERLQIVAVITFGVIIVAFICVSSWLFRHWRKRIGKKHIV